MSKLEDRLCLIVQPAEIDAVSSIRLQFPKPTNKLCNKLKLKEGEQKHQEDAIFYNTRAYYKLIYTCNALIHFMGFVEFFSTFNLHQ